MRFLFLVLLLAGCSGTDVLSPVSTPVSTPVAAPAVSITSISPTSSATSGGGTLTVRGALFETGLSVLVGAVNCTPVTFVSSSEVTCPLPAQAASTVSISITNPSGSAATLASAISYADTFAPPSVTAVSPSSGSSLGGTTVTISGSQFQTGATAMFGLAACTSNNVISATSMTCVTPAQAASVVGVTVTNPDSQSNTLNAAFTYVDPPTYTSLKADIFTSRCSSCHGNTIFSTQIYSEIVMKLVAGNPSGSLLYQRVADNSMPPNGGPLTAEEKQKIFDWIFAGAQDN